MKKRTSQNTKQFSLRINESLLRKFEFIASSQDRSINWMLIQLIAKAVKSYEEKHGEIVLDPGEDSSQP